MPRNTFPPGFAFVRWLKPETVAEMKDRRGRPVVLKKRRNARDIVALHRAIGAHTKTLKTLVPPFSAVDGFLAYPLIRGKPAGDTVSKLGFGTEALRRISPRTLARAVYELQSLSRFGASRRWAPKRRPAAWYTANLAEARAGLGRAYGAALYRRVRLYLERNAAAVDKVRMVMANGDLHPENIFYDYSLGDRRGKFVLLDWDIANFTNPGADVALLYAWSWRNDSWRRKLLMEFGRFHPSGERPAIEACFRFTAAYLAAQLIKHSAFFAKSAAARELRRRNKLLLDELLKHDPVRN